MAEEKSYEKKAALIADGHLFIPSDLVIPYPFGLSSAGPLIHTKSVVLGFDKHCIKMQVTRDSNVQFQLKKDSEKYYILNNGQKYLDNVEIISNRYHAPNQVFLNLESRCSFNCLFCEQRRNSFYINNFLDSRKIFLYLKKALEYRSVRSVAFTSGIYPNNTVIVRKFCSAVKKVKKINDELPIGVEPYIVNTQEIDDLKCAGADEIKINLQVPDKELFKIVCPDMDYSHILNMLDYAVDIFGKGKVCSNILFGLGETDISIITGIEDLAKRGITPTLRKVRLTQQNQNYIAEITGDRLLPIDKNRILNLGYKHKQILAKHTLTTESFKTMCHSCC